jgi:FecR protein
MPRGVRAAHAGSIVVALVLAIVVALGAPAGAKSTTTLAHLKIMHDGVTVKHKGQSTFVAAANGEAIRQGDTINTDATGKAEIDYTDGSLTRLNVVTIYTISKLTNDRGGRQTQGTLSVGETWNRAAKVSETGSFEVKAGGTTAAVEGTAFVVSCTPTSTAQQVTCTITAVVDNVNVDSDAWAVASVTTAP